MVIFGPSAVGAIVKLTCPRCGAVQVRARAAEGTSYACRECHHAFTREEVLANEAELSSGRRRR